MLHLLMNTLSLYSLGTQLEATAGTVGFGALVFLLATVSNGIYVMLCVLFSSVQVLTAELSPSDHLLRILW